MEVIEQISLFKKEIFKLHSVGKSSSEISKVLTEKHGRYIGSDRVYHYLKRHGKPPVIKKVTRKCLIDDNLRVVISLAKKSRTLSDFTLLFNARFKTNLSKNAMRKRLEDKLQVRKYIGYKDSFIKDGYRRLNGNINWAKITKDKKFIQAIRSTINHKDLRRRIYIDYGILVSNSSLSHALSSYPEIKSQVGLDWV